MTKSEETQTAVSTSGQATNVKRSSKDRAGEVERICMSETVRHGEMGKGDVPQYRSSGTSHAGR